MIEQWRELKETITELRDNDGTGTQQEVCKFLVNYMDVLEKQMRDATPEERESVDKYVKSISKPTGVDFWDLKQEPCEDAISRQYLVEKAVNWDKHFADSIRYVALTDILNAPSVMREATQEEREGVNQYIDSIEEPCDVLELNKVLDIIDKYKTESEEM